MNFLYRHVYLFAMLLLPFIVSAQTCDEVVLSLDTNDITLAAYSFTEDASITFTVEGGSENNLYRLRTKNEDGVTYTIITNPSYININNLAGATSEITINNLSAGDYDLFAYCGNDPSQLDGTNFKVKINPNSPVLTNDCAGIALTLNAEDIIAPTCGNTNDGFIKFTIVNGEANNLYRLRKILDDGGYEILTNPPYKSTDNIVGEPKEITIDGLEVGNYDLYAFCPSDPSKFSASTFSIDERNCAVEDCAGLELIINDSDIKRPSCGNTGDGSITFTVKRGGENNLYRLRKNNGGSSYTVMHAPDYKSLGNALGDNVTFTLSNLEAGNYDLYVYCPSDPINSLKGREITIGESVCDLTEGLVAHYPFNGLANDVSGNENHGIPTDITYTDDRDGVADNAFYFGGSSKVVLPSFEKDASASITFWYRAPGEGLGEGNNPMTFLDNDPIGDNDGDFLLAYNRLNCGNNTPAGSFSIEVQGDEINTNSPCSDNGYVHTSSTTSSWAGNIWYNVVVTVGDGELKMYIDGLLQSTETTTSSFFGNNTSVIIGNYLNQNNGSASLQGSMDDLRIYDKTLSANEIAVLVGLADGPVVENCEGIDVLLDQTSDAYELKFTILNGSEGNYYRLRKNNGDGTYTVLSNPTYVNIGNALGENKLVTITNIGTGTFDVFAYCGTNPGFFEGLAFTIDEEGIQGMAKTSGLDIAKNQTHSDESKIDFVNYDNDEDLSNVIFDEDDIGQGLEMTIYPNPSSDYVNIDLANLNSIGKSNVKIFSTTGNLMYHQVITTSAIHLDVDASLWSAGIYFFELISEDNIPIRERIVIAR